MEETLFRQELQKRTAAIEELLKEYLPAEEGYQKTVIEAMNYSLMDGFHKERREKQGLRFIRELKSDAACLLITGEELSSVRQR